MHFWHATAMNIGCCAGGTEAMLCPCPLQGLPTHEAAIREWWGWLCCGAILGWIVVLCYGAICEWGERWLR